MRLNTTRFWLLSVAVVFILVIMFSMNSGFLVSGFIVFFVGLITGLVGCTLGKRRPKKGVATDMTVYLRYWIIAGGLLFCGIAVISFTGFIPWLAKVLDFELGKVNGLWNYLAGFIIGGLILDAITLLRVMQRK